MPERGKGGQAIVSKNQLMFFDSHCHLNLPEFQNDWEVIANETLKQNTWMINVGVDLETSRKATAIAQKYDKGVYAAVGLHPLEEEKEDFASYEKLAKQPKVVAIGEIGLDFYHKKRTLAEETRQIILLLRQIRLGQKLSLPVIIHCRQAYQQLLSVFKEEFFQQRLEGVVHCFEGTLSQAQHLLDYGFYLGVNGLSLRVNLDDIIKNIPLGRILVETDSPYLRPPLFNGQRNVPTNVRHVVDKIAKVKNKSSREVAEQTTVNAKKLFHL
jgi:TatD DNase family protein